jgi:hypothetical protein
VRPFGIRLPRKPGGNQGTFTTFTYRKPGDVHHVYLNLFSLTLQV